MATNILTLGLVQNVVVALNDKLIEVTFPPNARWYRAEADATFKIQEKGGADGDDVGLDQDNAPIAYETFAANTAAIRDVPGTNGRKRNLDASTRKVWMTRTAGAIRVTAYSTNRRR